MERAEACSCLRAAADSWLREEGDGECVLDILHLGTANNICNISILGITNYLGIGRHLQKSPFNEDDPVWRRR